jgi:hypothetical protein
MKKRFLASYIVFFITGLGLTPPSIPVSAGDVTEIDRIEEVSPSNTPSASTQVSLLNPGSEPRQTLRLKPIVNLKEKLKMTMTMDMTMAVDGQVMPKLDPLPIEMIMDLEVKKVEENGDIYADFLYSEVNINNNSNTPPELVENMRAQLQQIVGLKGLFVIDSQGNNKEVNFILPEGMDVNYKQMFEKMVDSLKQLSSPLPVEEVGIGAQWQVSNTLNFNGINLNQVAVYKLSKLEETALTLDVTLQQQAAPQPVNLPGQPANVSVNLVSMDSKGSGKVLMSLDKLIPINGTMSMISNTKMNLKNTTDPKETNMDMNVSSNIILESQ